MMPTIKLSNGLTIANFSSPHTFTFTTGEVLEECSPERSSTLMLCAVEKETKNPKGFSDIDLNFELSDVVKEALIEAHENDVVDVVLVPFPVLSAVRESGSSNLFPKIRTIRCANRVTKEIYPDRFCV